MFLSVILVGSEYTYIVLSLVATFGEGSRYFHFFASFSTAIGIGPVGGDGGYARLHLSVNR